MPARDGTGPLGTGPIGQRMGNCVKTTAFKACFYGRGMGRMQRRFQGCFTQSNNFDSKQQEIDFIKDQIKIRETEIKTLAEQLDELRGKEV